MRLQSIVLCSFLASSLAALRGERRAFAGRRADVSIHTKEKAVKTTSDETKKTKTKDVKTVKTKDVKTVNKTKEQKCKKVKKAAPKDHEVTPVIDEPVEPDDAPYCLHGQRSPEECEALARGEVPDNDKSVKGHLGILAHSDNNSATPPEAIMSKVQDILRTRTSLKFVGCPEMQRSLLPLLQEEEDTEFQEEPVSVTGVGFGKLKISDTGGT